MGDLLLCDVPATGKPYYIEGISVNIYSMEELCYYIANHTYLLDKSFMDIGLCAWLEREFHKEALAARLRRLIEEGGKISAFVQEVLNGCGYCTSQEKKEILQILSELEEKSDFECRKIRADRLMEKEKFLSSIYEYKRLLDSKDAEEVSAQLRGDIWHNLAIAYARMFIFDEAASCFSQAFALNERQESLKAQLFTLLCMHNETDFIKVARANGMDDVALQELQNEWSIRKDNPHTEEFRQQINQVLSSDSQEYRKKYKQEISDIIFRWKEDYRRISRV